MVGLPLILVALALWAIAAFLFRPKVVAIGPPFSAWGSAGILAALFALAAWKFAPVDVRGPVIVGIGSALLGAGLAAWRGGGAGGVAIAVISIGLPGLFPTFSSPATSWAVVATLAGLAWVLNREGTYTAAIAAAGIAVLNDLGGRNEGPDALRIAGTTLGLVVATLSVASLALTLAAESGVGGRREVRGVLVALAASAAGGYVATAVLKLPGGWLLAGVGGLVGVLNLVLLSEEDTSVLTARTGLAGIVSIGAATVAFSEGKGLGVAVAALVALAGPLAVGHWRSVAAVGPLLLLALYRGFREAFTDVTKAFDIGQHYTLIALLLGVLIPIALADAQASRSMESFDEEEEPGWQARLAAVLAWLLVLTVPTVTTLLFGGKSIVGWIVGLGLAGFLMLSRSPNDSGRIARASAMAGGLGASTVLVYGWFPKLYDLTRDDKLKLLVTVFGGYIVAVAILAALLRRPKSGSATPVGSEAGK